MKKIGLMVLVASILVVGCGKKAAMKLPEHHVDVMVVQSYNVPYVLDYPATVQGLADFQVIPRVSGVIQKQLYKEGSLVKKDQPLYQIDPRPYQNKLAEDQGQLVKDTAAMVENKSILDRYIRLYKIFAVSKQDIETQNIAYKAAFGQVQTDMAMITDDKLNIEYCLVKAPVAGLISERVVTVGTMVTEFQTILTNINSPSALYINFSVPENDRLDLQKGIASGKISVPSDYQFGVNLQLADGSMINKAGSNNFFDTRVSLQNGTWNMRADVDNKKIQNQLLSGQFVHIYLTGASFKNAVAIPQAAVFRDNQGAFVYVVDTGSKVEKRPVNAGMMAGDLWIINSGLADGDKVVINGGMKVTPGNKVIVDTSTDQSKISASGAV